MSYLLDKMVLQEIDKDELDPKVEAWWGRINETDIFVSVASVMEGRKGIEELRKSKLRKQRSLRDHQRVRRKHELANSLERDLSRIIEEFRDRFLPVNVDVADLWGKMLAIHGGDWADAVIAATAKSHRLAVVTRNVIHFSKYQVRVINPFKDPPEIIEPS